jgi:hypothetical protein
MPQIVVESLVKTFGTLSRRGNQRDSPLRAFFAGPPRQASSIGRTPCAPTDGLLCVRCAADAPVVGFGVRRYGTAQVAAALLAAKAFSPSSPRTRQ